MSKSQLPFCRFLGGALALVALVAGSANLAHAALVGATWSSNNFRTGFTIGYEFTVGSTPYTINALGVEADGTSGFGGALTQNHAVEIWNSSGGTVAGALATVSSNSNTLVGAFRYAMLGTPVTLSANTSYFIGTYFAGGDTFNDVTGTFSAGSSDITINYNTYAGGGSLLAPSEPTTNGNSGGANGRWAGANATFIATTSTWNGATSGSWSVAGNWVANTAPAANNSLDFGGATNLATTNDLAANTQFAGITFDSTAGAFTLSGNAVNLTDDVVNSSTATQTIAANLVLDGGGHTFNTAAGNMLVSGNISQANGTANGLYKTGAGTLTLSGSNSYAGPTVLLGGVLSINGSNNLGDGSATNTIVISGGTLDSSANSYSLGSNQTITLGSPGTIQTDAGALTISGSVSQSSNLLTVQGAGSTILSGPVGGSGGLTKLGAGMLTLGASNTYTGVTNVNGGTLQVAAGGVINNAAAININGTSTPTFSISGGSVTTSGQVIIAGVASQPGALSISSGMLSLSGGGNALYLGSNNVNNNATANASFTQTGGTVNVVGTVLTGNSPTASTITVNGGSFSVGGTLYLGIVSGGSGVLTIANPGTSATLGTLDLAYAAGSSGTLNLNGGTLQVSNEALGGGGTGTGTFNFNGGVLQAGAGFSTPSGVGTVVQSGGAIINTNGFNMTIASALSNGGGGGGLIKNGGGTLTFSVANTYAGGTTVSGGTLQLGNALSLQDSTFNTSGFGTLSFGTLSTATFAGLAGSNSLTLPNNLALTVGNNGVSSTFSGALGGSGSLTKIGGGTLVLSGTNTYTGTTTISAGILQTVSPSAIPGTVNINGGVLQTMGNNYSFNATNLSFASGGIQNGSATTNMLLTVGADNSSATYGGVLANGGAATLALDKTGSGNLTLAAANTYTGPTTVNGGTLNVAGSIYTTNSTQTISVANGATLQVSNAGNNPLGWGSGQTWNVAGAVNLTAGEVQILPGTLNLNGGTLTSTQTNSTYGSYIAYSYNQLLTANGSGNAISSKDFGINGGYTVTLNTPLATDALSASTVFKNGNIAGGALAKAGLGVLTLTGSSTYTGGTSIGAGAMYVNGALSNSSTVTVVGGATLGGIGSVGTTTVQSGGTIEGGYGGVGVLTLSNLAFSNSATVNLTPDSIPPVNVIGALTANGAANSVVINVGTTSLTAGDYPLIGYSGTIQGTGGFGAFTLGTKPADSNIYTLKDITGGSSYLDLFVALDAPYWSGANGTAWDAGTVNWQVGGAGGAPSTYSDGLPVVFDDSALGSIGGGTVAINGADVGPASVTFNNNAVAYTLQGANAITGSTGLTKGGAGTLTIANVNSFTGAVSFNGGTVSVGTLANGGVNSPLGAGTSLAFNSGTLEYTGVDAAPTTDRAVTLNSAGGTFQVDNPGTMLTLSGSIGGVGGLTKSGPGSLALTNSSNSFAGGVTVSGGTLTVAAVANSGVNSYLGAGSNMALGGGATLEYTGTDATPSTDRGLALNAGGGIVQIDNAATSLTLAGAISGSGGLTLAGNGALILSAANSYSGGTTVSGGTLQISADNNLGATGTGITLGNATTLVYPGNGNMIRPITLIGGATISDNSPSGIDLWLTGPISGGSLTVIGGSHNIIIAPTSGTNSMASLTAAAGGITYINNQNSLGTASVTVNSGGIFDVYGGSLNPTNTMIFAPGSGIGNRTGTLTLNTANATFPSSGTLNYNTGNSGGNTVFNGDYPVLTGGMTFNVAANTLTLNGALSDNGSGSLIKTGNGTLVLAGSNSYSGGTTISAGYLQAVNANAIPGALTINGGVLQTMGNNYSFNATNLSFTGGGIQNGSATTNVTITAGADNSSATFGGALANGAAATLALTKAGSGTLTLNALSSYTGGTIVNGGTLAVNAGSGIPDGTALTINNGGYVSLVAPANAIHGLASITINTGGVLSADGPANGGPSYGAQAHTLLSTTGTLDMNGGTLAGDAYYNLLYGQFYLQSGATIDATGTTLSTISGVLGINSGSQLLTVNVDAGAELLVSGRLLGNNGGDYGGINKTGLGTLDLSNPLNGTSPTGGLALTGVTLTAGTVSFVSGGLGSGAGGNAAPSLLADFAGNATLTWDAGNTQDISASSKLKIDDGAVATFNTGGNNVTLGTPIVLGTLKSGGLAKAGNGTLTLAASNSYVGGTTVSGGVLQLGNVSALGASTGNLTVNAGTLDLAGYSPSVGGLNGLAGTILSSSANSSTFTTSVAGGTATFGGSIGNGAGTVALVLGGPGTQVLTGNNTYTGGTTIDGGVLQLGDGVANNGSVTGNVLDNRALTFANYAPQSFAGAISGTGALNISGPAVLTLTGSNGVSGLTTISGGTLQLGDGVSGNGSVAGNISDNAVLTFANYAPQTYAGALSGAGALNVNGPTLTLTGDNSAFTGATTIGGGTLVFANASAENFASPIAGSGGVLVNAADVLTLSASNGYSGGTTIEGGTLLLGNSSALGSGAVLVAGGQLDLGSFSPSLLSLTLASGTLTSSGGGTVNVPVVKNTSGTAYLNGTGLLNGSSLSVTDGQLILGSPQSANGLSVTGGTLAGSTLTLGGPSPIDAESGVISTNLAGSAGLNKTTANSVLLLGNNSYAGGTSIEGGTLQLGSATALPTGSNLTVNGGTLDLNGQNPTVAAVAGLGVGVISNSSTAAATINVSGTAPRMGATLADGNGTTGLIKSGNGTLLLSSSANSYSGGTTVSGGVLQLGSAAALGSSNGALEVDAGTLDLAGNSPTVGVLSGTTGTISSSTGPATLTTGTGGGSSSFSGLIVDGVGPVALMKIGSGTLTLGSANTYTGGTTINGGVLSISNSANLGSGDVTIGPGALQTTGTVVLDAARTITLTDPTGAIDTPNYNDSVTIAGLIAGSGALNKTGAGTLALADTGGNTYSGDTNVLAGTLRAAVDNALSPSSNLVISDGASVILDFDGGASGDSMGAFVPGMSALSAPALATPALSPAGISTVPEPGTLVLLLVGALVSFSGIVASRLGHSMTVSRQETGRLSG